MAWDDALKGDWSKRVRRSYKAAFDAPTNVLTQPFITSLFEVGWLMKDIPDEIRNGARSTMRQYLWDHFRLRFEQVFDWEAWREAYNAAV